jgi:hypothetical protein
MAARGNPAHRCIGVGGDVRRRGAAQADGEARSWDRALTRWGGCRLADECVTLRGDARSLPALRPRLSRALAGATAAPWRRRTRSILVGGHWCRDDACGGGRDRPSLAPRAEFLTVSEAHQVAVPRSLKVQTPEPDFESCREGIRATHGVALTAVLGANHHRESRWRVDLQCVALPGAPTVGAESSPDTN